MKLTWSKLNSEYLEWSRENGEGRNKNDLRFGQYLYIKYDLTDLNNLDIDPFYVEGCENVYSMLLGCLYEKDQKTNVSRDLCQKCNKRLIKKGELCFCQTRSNRYN